MAISVRRPVPAHFPITGEYLDTTPPTWSAARPHLGVDFGCPSGTAVSSATIQGKVHDIHRPNDGWGDGSFGICVVIDVVGTPWYYLYAHLSSVAVSVGQTVNPGDLIGLSGATGFVTGAHLHVQASESPNFPRDVNITGDPILGLRGGTPPPTPETPPTGTPSLADVAASLNSLNNVVGQERLANAQHNAALSARLDGIETVIYAIRDAIQALPKG